MKWPERREVDRAVRQWSRRQARLHPELVRLGYFGSYARGDAGVGSDLDLIAVIEQTAEPFLGRAASWQLEDLPVPAEILVYTREEWQELSARGGRFAETLGRESVWIHP